MKEPAKNGQVLRKAKGANSAPHPGFENLSADDRETMAQYRARLSKIESNWIDKATILRDIRSRRLYRLHWATFESFCSEELEMTKTNVNRLIQSAVIAEEMATIVAKPKRENHFRALLRLETPSQRQTAYQNALAVAANARKTLTGAMVAQAVRELRNSAVGTSPVTAITKADLLTRITRGLTRGLEQLDLDQLQHLETALTEFKKSWIQQHLGSAPIFPAKEAK